MPLIVNNIILNIMTERTPWPLRPLVGFLLGKLRAVIVEPGLRIHAQMVSNAEHDLYLVTGPMLHGRSSNV